MNFVDNEDRPNSQFAAILVSVLLTLIFVGVVCILQDKNTQIA